MACYCCVQGCKNNNHKPGTTRHFFRFPKNDPKRCNLWTKFARKRVNQTSVVCEDHFESRFKIQKDKKVKLSADAIPTIFYKADEECIAQITLDFDGENYVGEEAEEIQLANDQEIAAIETAFVNEQLKLEELKSRCRFCSELKDEITIEMATFANFNIEIKTFLATLELTAPESDFFPNAVCEECFNQVLHIDAFIVKCRSSEQWFWDEIGKLKTISPAVAAPVRVQRSVAEVEYAVKEIQEEQVSDENFEESIIQEGESEGEEVVEDLVEETFEVEYEESTHSVDSDQPPAKKSKIPGNAILDPKCNKFALKAYECEMCEKIFAGLKTYKSHVCDVPEIRCHECGDLFDTIFALKHHTKHLHRDLCEKNFCSTCKVVISGNHSAFKKHRLKCNKEYVSEYVCQKCPKTFKSMQQLTVHALFHESQIKAEQDTLAEDTSSKPQTTKRRAEVVCELCGKSYTTMGDCRRHIKLKHTLITETFTCDICNKNYPSMSVLKDHIRNTHVVNEVACTFCGKIFRNKTHLKKHMVYHDDSKKVHKCMICPNQPGFVNKIGLQRHQAKHSGISSSSTGETFSCEICVNYNFHSEYQLKSHMKHVHAIEQSSA